MAECQSIVWNGCHGEAECQTGGKHPVRCRTANSPPNACIDEDIGPWRCPDEADQSGIVGGVSPNTLSGDFSD